MIPVWKLARKPSWELIASFIDDVKAELEKIQKEDKENEQDPVMASMFGNQVRQDDGGQEVQGKSLNGAQTQSLIAIMSQLFMLELFRKDRQ